MHAVPPDCMHILNYDRAYLSCYHNIVFINFMNVFIKKNRFQTFFINDIFRDEYFSSSWQNKIWLGIIDNFVWKREDYSIKNYIILTGINMS